MIATAEKINKAANAIFGKTYELSITKGYVSRWGMVQAVRELIQNALDSSSPFIYEFTSGGYLRLTSEFSTLTPQSLLLGATSKGESEDSIGSFGEGYKLALLVLTRMGYEVEMLNGDVIWRPRFRFSRSFGDEILVIEETVAPNRSKGLTVTIGSLTESEVEEIRASCLRMQENVGAIKQTEFGDILLDQPGKLYVGSLYICETEMKYGYNIKPKHMRLERDRQTVSSWDLKDLSLKCWYATGEADRVAQMIADEFEDVGHAQYDSPLIIKEACYKIFRERHPTALLAISPTDAKRKIEDTMIEHVYVGSSMYSIVTGSTSYRTEARKFEKEHVAPHVALASFLSTHRDEMRRPAIVAFKALILEAQKRWVSK